VIITKKSLPRRTFLRGLGAAVALPLLDSMTPAFAAPGRAAVARMAFLYTPNGVIMKDWTPAAEGAGFEFTKTLQPIEAFRGKLLVLSGLEQHNGESLGDGALTVDVARRVARLHGAELALTVREFDLLVFLMRHPSRAFRRGELLEAVWGWTFGDQSTVTVHVRRLREKIERDPAAPRRILTVWGVGYRYERANG